MSPPRDKDAIQSLDEIDLEKLTIAEIRALKNPVLRRVLFEAISVITAKPEHTSHGSHTSHLKDLPSDIRFGEAVVSPLGPVEGIKRIE
jgi:hypothetical protein